MLCFPFLSVMNSAVVVLLFAHLVFYLVVRFNLFTPLLSMTLSLGGALVFPMAVLGGVPYDSLGLLGARAAIPGV
jgi:hypothetical protein